MESGSGSWEMGIDIWGRHTSSTMGDYDWSPVLAYCLGREIAQSELQVVEDSYLSRLYHHMVQISGEVDVAASKKERAI